MQCYRCNDVQHGVDYAPVVLKDAASHRVDGNITKLREKPANYILNILYTLYIAQEDMTLSTCQTCSIEIEVPNLRTKLCSTCCRNNRLERCKRYKQANRHHVSEYNKKNKSEHKEEISKYNKEYFTTHKDEINIRRRGYKTKYHAKNPQIKLYENMRSRIWTILKSNRKQHPKSMELLGCSKPMFKDWLEFQFLPHQTFENYGNVWHMDHCMPYTKFDIGDADAIKKCFNWANLQPMDAEKNIKKGNKTSLWEQVMQELKVTVFLKQNKKYRKYELALHKMECLSINSDSLTTSLL